MADYDYDYDVVIIGAGPGGLAAAYGLASSQHVLVVENNLWGGTCPNFGCDPKKMLYGVVEAQRQVRNYQDSGLTGHPSVNWADMMAFKRSYTDGVPGGTEQGLAGANIDHIHGTATFRDAHTLAVGDRVVTTDKVVVATGAHANIPDIPGKELLSTSTDFLALPDRPQSIGFIGAGYVAVELANIAAEAGVAVHVFQHNRRLLRAFPEEYSDRVAEQLRAKGVQWHWDTEIASVRSGADGGVVAVTAHGEEVALDYLVAAAGRGANIEKLNLEAAGVEYSRGGIQVNEHLQSSAANVFVIGDAVAKRIPKLTPTASFEGRYVAGAINGDAAPINYPVVPHTVFAGPELAQVGVSLDEAQAHPDTYEVLTQDVGSWYTYHRIRDDNARVTTITERVSGQLVGAIALATNAEELINYCTGIITQGLPASALPQWIPVYPSVASDLGYFYN